MTTTAPISTPVAPQVAAPPRVAAASAGRQPVGPTIGAKSHSAAQGHGVDLRPNQLLQSETMLQAQRSDDDPDGDGLNAEEEAVVRDMKERDAEVRQHEQAHARVGGRYAGAPQYQHETGPDGRRYAVSGSVAIDVSPVAGDPEETIRKMDIVKRAALAPADPSAQDRAVAARAQQEKLTAQRELQQQKNDTPEPGPGRSSTPASDGGAGIAATAGIPETISAGLLDAVV